MVRGLGGIWILSLETRFAVRRRSEIRTRVSRTLEGENEGERNGGVGRWKVLGWGKRMCGAVLYRGVEEKGPYNEGRKQRKVHLAARPAFPPAVMTGFLFFIFSLDLLLERKQGFVRSFEKENNYESKALRGVAFSAEINI
ncbi:hypothetical protein V8G54_012420, partial [Vigna mungo]